MLSSEQHAELGRVLVAAQQRGWVGPASADEHIQHSLGFSRVVPEPPSHVVDLGSGGGLPALVLACAWPDSEWLLVEASLRRAAFLEERVAALRISNRVRVLQRRAEDLSRAAEHRAHADLVTARSFGSPSETLELAAPFLRVGGNLVVGASPDALPWPANLTATVGLGPDLLPPGLPRFHAAVQQELCPQRFPRSAKERSRVPLRDVSRETPQ